VAVKLEETVICPSISSYITSLISCMLFLNIFSSPSLPFVSPYLQQGIQAERGKWVPAQPSSSSSSKLNQKKKKIKIQ
jgi:hypothetical protein